MLYVPLPAPLHLERAVAFASDVLLECGKAQPQRGDLIVEKRNPVRITSPIGTTYFSKNRNGFLEAHF